MNLSGIFTIAMAIVSVAGLTVAVTSPNFANIISAAGGAFKGALSTAMGKGG